MIEGKIDATQFNRRLDKMIHASGPIMIRQMGKAVSYVRNYISKYKLSGQVFNRKTGRLAGSMDSEAYSIGGAIVGRVGSNLRYARIRSLGGIIEAKNAPYLVFKTGGHWVKTKSVEQKPNPYIMPGIKESTRKIIQYIGHDFITDLVTEGRKVM